MVSQELLRSVQETTQIPEQLQRRHIVVTGIGMVTPLGLNAKDSWNGFVNGKSGISEVDFPYTQVKVAGLIHGFDPYKALDKIVERKEIGRRTSRPIELATAASHEALGDAKLLKDNTNEIIPGVDRTRIGVRIGTGIGGANLIAKVSETLKSGKRISPFDVLRIEVERVSTVVSMKFGLQGSNETPSAACATGNLSIIGGYKDIFLGDADIMVVGGVESSIDENVLSLFEAVKALTLEKDPKKASRPFDKKRNGFVMSEAAAVLVLEELEHAKKRGARIYAELAGYGATADAHNDVEPSGEGAKRAMQEAFRKAGGVPPTGDIYINAHATSTSTGDPVEVVAVKEVIPDHHRIKMSGTKSESGHGMGAAGAMEAAICVLAIRDKVVPPTINLEDPIEEAKGINLVPNEAQLWKGDLAVNNSFGFGGINATTIFIRYSE